MNLNNKHEQILKEKYALDLDNPTIKAMLNDEFIKSVKSEEVNRLLGRNDIKSGGLQIKYPNSPETFTIRLNESLIDQKTQKERRYLKPTGQTNGLYIPQNLVGIISNLNEIWVIEGEMKALSGAIKGLPIVALSGIWGWRTDKITEKSDIDKLYGSGKTSDIRDSEALIDDLNLDYSGKKVVLIYDSDINQNHVGWDSYVRLSDQLYRLGAEEVKIFTTPSIGNEDKTGLDDIFSKAQNDGISLEEVIKDLKEKVRNTPAFLPMKDGAKTFKDKVENKGSDATHDEKIRATAVVLATEGKEEASRFVSNFGSGKRSLINEAVKLLKKCKKSQSAIRTSAGLDGIQKTIQSMMLNNKFEQLPTDILKDNIFQAIYKAMDIEGKFYYSSPGSVWWLHNNKLYDVNTMEFTTFFTNKTGLTAKSDKGQYVLDRMYSKVSEEATRVDVKIGAFYNQKTNVLYLDTFDGQVLRIDYHKVQKVDMGTDNIIFYSSPDWEPWDYIEFDKNDLEDFNKLMFGFNFSSGSKLNPEYAKHSITAWRLAGFFREINPTKPILLLKGEKGTGKTNMADMWLKVIYGRSASVMSIDTSNKDQINTIITNDHWVCFDNVDSESKGIEDILAILATGGTIPKRIFFTTNQIAKYKIVSWATITTRNPKFLRDDICDRIIPIYLDKLNVRLPENQLLGLLEEKRSKFLSIIVDMLKEIIRYIYENGFTSQSEDLRMADFASFLRLYINCVDKDNADRTTEDIVAGIIKAQQFLLVDEDPVIELISTMLKSSSLQKNKPYKSSDLLAKVNSTAKNFNISININTTKQLNSILREKKDAINTIYGIDFKIGNTNGYSTVSFL